MSAIDADQPPNLSLPEAADYAASASELTRAARAHTRHRLDIPYGDHERQKVDIYLPDDEALAGLPVLLFMHGGAWRNGERNWVGFMAPPVVAWPAILVSVGYRLAPAAKFPAPLEDCLDALAWVYRNIEEQGGDSDRLFVGGHSSGGHLASLVALRPDLVERRGLPADAVKACFPLSAPLECRLDRSDGRRKAVILNLLARPEDDRDATPLTHTAGNRVPFYLSHGSQDLPEVMENNRRMSESLAGEDCAVRYEVFEGLGHFESVLQCADPESPWLATVRHWLTG